MDAGRRKRGGQRSLEPGPVERRGQLERRRARQIGGVLSESAETTTAALSEQFEQIRAATAKERERTANALRAAIAARGQASLAVSGGKSPIPLFEALREQDLDWSKVSVVLADERVVPRDHADSNTALVARHLLQGRAAAARFLLFFRELAPTFNAEVLDALVRDAEERIRSLPWPLDVAVLGMGEDAHTASLILQSLTPAPGMRHAPPHPPP